MVTHDEGLRKEAAQLAEQGQQGGALGQGARVFGVTLGIQSAFVADADGVSVVVEAVSAGLFQRSPVVDFSVAGDVEVVADVTESAVADVVLPAGFRRKGFPFGGGAAMNDEETDGSHGYIQLWIPNAPATAVATVTMIFRMRLQVERLVGFIGFVCF